MTETTCPICKQKMEARSAFIPVVNNQGKGFILGRADENITGYTPIYAKTFEKYDEAQEIADYLNNEMGLSKEDAFRIICSTMRNKNNKSPKEETVVCCICGDNIPCNEALTSGKEYFCKHCGNVERIKSRIEDFIQYAVHEDNDRQPLMNALDDYIEKEIAEGYLPGE